MRRLALIAVLATLIAAPASRAASGVWLTRAEIAALPESGPAWGQVLELARSSTDHPDLSNQDSEADVRTLAAALVYAFVVGLEIAGVGPF
jgi:hypothetical protein